MKSFAAIARLTLLLVALPILSFSQTNRVWATYYGGAGFEFGFHIATDGNGNVYMAGTSSSGTGIASGGFQNNFGGGPQDAYLVKFDAAGNRLWATYYGGGGEDMGYSVTTDATGNVYMAGMTNSTNNIASGGFQNTFGGGQDDGFLVKFDPAGNRLWATYYGGTSFDEGNSVSTDAMGNVFLSGWTMSTSTIASGGFQNTYGGGMYDAYLVKFDAATGNRLWATYYGGPGDDKGFSVTNDASGNLFLSGGTSSTTNIASVGFQNIYGGGAYDAFLVKFDATTGNRLWATYYGGGGTEFYYGNIAADAFGNIYLAGLTGSTSGIASGGYQNTYGGGTYDSYLVKFDVATGNRIWGTYYGGSALDACYEIAIDPSGYLYLAGWTISTSGIASSGFQNTVGGGTWDSFLVKFDPLGNRMCATYYGGSNMEQGTSVAIDPSGNVYVSGETASTNNIGSGGFQNSYGGGLYDGFLVKFTSCFNSMNVTTASTNILCNGQCNGTATANPSGGVSPYTYSWNTSPVQTTQIATGLCAGNYTVTVIDALSTSDTAVVSITQPSTVAVSTSSVSNVSCNSFCDGSALAIATGGTSPYTYSWNNTQTNSSATGLCAGTYSVTTTDANGCTSSQTISITQPTAIVLQINSTDASCGSNNGTASVTANGGTGTLSYNWTPTGGTNTSANGLAAGNYTVTITDANGCTQTISTTIISLNGPTATVSAIATSIASGGSSQLTASGGGNYSWFPSTGLSCTSCSNPIATPNQTTTYCVIITDTNGCTDSDCLTINVDSPCQGLDLNKLLPNAFSPNDDVLNSVYCVPQNLCIKNFELHVYDRWGEKVFESSSFNMCWNGTYEGKLLNTDVFAYTFTAILDDGTVFTQKGNISLIR